MSLQKTCEEMAEALEEAEAEVSRLRGQLLSETGAEKRLLTGFIGWLLEVPDDVGLFDVDPGTGLPWHTAFDGDCGALADQYLDWRQAADEAWAEKRAGA